MTKTMTTQATQEQVPDLALEYAAYRARLVAWQARRTRRDDDVDTVEIPAITDAELAALAARS